MFLYKCKWCGGRLGQIYHILVHECGEMKQLWVPTCTNQTHQGRRTRVVLDFRNSQKAMDFRWVCKDCGQTIRQITRWCDKCSDTNGDVTSGGGADDGEGGINLEDCKPRIDKGNTDVKIFKFSETRCLLPCH